MEYDDDDAEMEYDDITAMALHMSVNGGGPLSSMSGPFNSSCSESDDTNLQAAFFPSFDVQPDHFASILRNVGQSIGSMPMPLSDQSMDHESCSTSEGLIQWMDSLDDPSAATSSDGEIYHQLSTYELVSPVLSIPPSMNLQSAPSIFQPSAGTAYCSGNSEDRHLAISVKRRKIGG